MRRRESAKGIIHAMDKWENKRFFARINGRWDLGKAVGRIRLGEEGLREALCRIWGAATATREMGARCSAIARPRRRDLAVTHASWVHARELRRAHPGNALIVLLASRLTPAAARCPKAFCCRLSHTAMACLR